jgi:DNA helicase-2/ATP-dependent DNA helicase PcrA
LNAEQRAAVVHRGTPLLIVAGAGSGKTRVLTRRIAYLLATGQAQASQIMAITFTNKAAAEMRLRVERLVGPRARAMWVSTFHSACVRILRREAEHLGLKKSFSIYDAQDSLRLITLVVKELNLDPKRFQPKAMAHRISNLKNELIDAEAYASEVSEANPLEHATADVYRLYQSRLQAAHALDFDDLIMRTVSLLQAFPGVAEHYHRRFRHILVDEYQDTNQAQYVLVRELTGVGADARRPGGFEPAELTVVGDSDQSIYAFRGATIRNISEFETDYPDAATIMLEQNYRSTQNILDAANAVIAPNQRRQEKRLWTAEGAGPKVIGYVADSEHDEAEFIAGEIDRLTDDFELRPGDAAVFYRTNAQSRALEEVFIRRGIPYRVVGGTRFYERKEIRDAIAYLRAADNRDDSVSIGRIFNLPKRGLGGQAAAAIAVFAAGRGISFGAALALSDQINGLTPRAQRSVAEFDRLLSELAEMSQHGAGPAQILDFALDESGYLAELQSSRDPQDASRVENLAELHAVASEFETSQPNGSLADFLERVSLVADSDQLPLRAGQAASAESGTSSDSGGAGETWVPGDPPDDDGYDADRFGGSTPISDQPGEGTPGGDPGGAGRPAAQSADQAGQPAAPTADQAGNEAARLGQVTLMTVHTAKGLEFPVVFVTGLEDGTFPHRRSMGSAAELEEERRLAYVALTRARQRLYLSRAEARTTFGRAEYYPASQFLDDIPTEVLEWRRESGSRAQLQSEGSSAGSWDSGGSWGARSNLYTQSRTARRAGRSGGLSPAGAGQAGSGQAGSGPTINPITPRAPRDIPQLAPGDLVTHDSYGLGQVLTIEGDPPNQVARIEFRAEGVKRILLRFAPVTRL